MVIGMAAVWPRTLPDTTATAPSVRAASCASDQLPSDALIPRDSAPHARAGTR